MHHPILPPPPSPTTPTNPPRQAQALAAMNGHTIEFATDFQMGVTNRTPEFLSKFPLGKVPAFESADGDLHLTEGQAIARYAAESGPRAAQLVGGDAKTRAIIEQWSCFAEQELAGNLLPPLLMCVFKMAPWDEARYNQCVANFERAAKRVELALQGGRRFLVGEEITMADVMVVGVLQVAARFVMDKEMIQGLKEVERYVREIMEVKEVKEAFGAPEFCEKRVRAD